MLKLSRREIRDVSSAVRPLGSIEHLFLLLDKNSPAHFAVTAEVSGRTNVDDWRKALDRVQQRHPLLSMTIGHAPGAVPGFRHGKGVSIPLRVLRDDPQKRWAAEVGEELARPIDPSSCASRSRCPCPRSGQFRIYAGGAPFHSRWHVTRFLTPGHAYRNIGRRS